MDNATVTFLKSLIGILEKDDTDSVVKATFTIGDEVLTRKKDERQPLVAIVEEVLTKGSPDGNLATEDKPVYKLRVTEYDKELGEHVPTSETIFTYSDNMKSYADLDKAEIGDVVYLKFNDGYGEVVYRTEESVHTVQIDRNGNVVNSTDNFYVYNVYDTQWYEEVPMQAEIEYEDEYKEDKSYEFDNLTFTKSGDKLFVYGIFSSHYMDSDRDILTGAALEDFAKRVNDEVVPLPDIRIAHLPIVVGKCEVIDYDDRGFAVFGGTINKDWIPYVEEIVINSEELGIELGLSHGFLAKSVEYDHMGFITKFTSYEVSILPVNREYVEKDGTVVKLTSASNKFTRLLASTEE
jgi:hypothetical protein